MSTPEDIVRENKQIAEADVVTFFQENFSITPQNLKSGENSFSFQYNGFRIRFPKKESSIQDYEKEAYVSRFIKENAPDLLVPVVDMQEKNGQKFSVHQEIVGKTLIGCLPEDHDNIHFESLTQAEKMKLAKDIGMFLAKLHNIPLDQADVNFLKSKQMGIQSEKSADYIDENKKLYDSLGVDYVPVHTDKEDLVLSHNDFHGGNFILDHQNNFKGAIDLGEAGINYRCKDFMHLYTNCGRKFIRDVVHSYNEHSRHMISMQELDFHHLNKIADFAKYASKPQYKDKAPQLKEMFDKCIEDYKGDKNREEKQNMVQQKLKDVKERLSPSTSGTKMPLKNQTTKADFNFSGLCCNEKNDLNL